MHNVFDILSEIFMADILRQQTTLQRFFFVQLVVTVCRSNNDTNRRIKRSGSFIYLAKLCRHLTTCAYLPSVIECHLRTFFLLLFIFTSLLSCPTFIRPRFCWFTENLLSPCVGVIPHNPPQQKRHSVVVAVFWCCKNAHTYFIITFCMVDSQILRSLILRRLCKLNSILIVIKLNARLFICCFSLHTVYVLRGIQL